MIFLQRKIFYYYKEQLSVYFQYVALFGFEQEGILIGFMGIAEGNLEMLFIDNNYRSIGIGKKLVTYAINHLQVTKVDVNEQNIQAVGFYKYIGFSVYKRSDLDGEGKEYPILHMQLQFVSQTPILKIIIFASTTFSSHIRL